MDTMKRVEQVQRARALTALHVPGDPLLLPNAWDAASAHVIARAGAKAIATSSASCAWSTGHADGDRMTRAQAMAPVAAIVAAVDLPVTADVETGYAGDGAHPDAALTETVQAVITAGAVGVNLEDSGGDPLYSIEVAAHRIAVARAAADAAGVPIYLNARVDTYFAPEGQETGRFARTVERAAAYLAAGASGIFVPGVRDLDLIRRLTAAIDAPVNILAGPSTPSRAELAAAGVGRISTGSSLNLSVLATLADRTGRLLRDGTFTELGGIPYAEINTHFAERSQR